MSLSRQEPVPGSGRNRAVHDRLDQSLAVMGPLWYYLRPPEAILETWRRKSHADFKKFMRERRRLDQVPSARLDKRTTPEKPLEIGSADPNYRDLHLEELINSGNYNEAMRNAK